MMFSPAMLWGCCLGWCRWVKPLSAQTSAVQSQQQLCSDQQGNPTRVIDKEGASQQPGTGRAAPTHAPPASIIALNPSNTPGRKANKTSIRPRYIKRPQATLNHLKILPLNRIIVPIKNQSSLEPLALLPVPCFLIKQIFPCGFLVIKHLILQILAPIYQLTSSEQP